MISLAALSLIASATLSDSLPSCATDLALLERKMHEDYAGYALELRGERLQKFTAMKTRLQVRADFTRGAACFFVLNDFVAWFDDPHLFIYQSARMDSAEITRRIAGVDRRAVTEAGAREYFRRSGPKLDPIEGIWYDEGLRVAIVPDSVRGAGRFVAVVLTSDTTTWTPGAVRATFVKNTAGGYLADVSARNHSLGHRNAEVYRHMLLRLSPGIWGKEFPVAAADSGTLDPVDPHRPVAYRRNGTLVFAIPSHASYTGALDSLVAQHRAELSRADKLIIDLRGNEGGGSFMTHELEAFMTLAKDRPTPYTGTKAMILSSADQIAYTRRSFGPETTAFVRTLLERMRARPGELVPLNDPAAPAEENRRDWVVASGPRAVGVIADRGTVSASEVTVLHALESARTTVFGENTAGALDYQSTYIVPLSPREPRWLLGYGTITRSADLPRNGMRGKGIAPQVRLNLKKIADPVAVVIKALAVAP